MLSDAKGARLLEGFRGRPAADVEASAQALMHISHLAMRLDGRLVELDVTMSYSEGDSTPDGLPMARCAITAALTALGAWCPHTAP